MGVACLTAMEERSERRILILGVGNSLLGDEGIGIHAVRELAKRALPPHVDVVDGDTAGLGLLDTMMGYERVVIVDAVDAGEGPGAIFRFAPDEATFHSDALPLSLHQTDVLKVLKLGTYLGRALPPVIIYGVQPEAMGWNTELSSELKASLPRLLDALLEEITRQDEV